MDDYVIAILRRQISDEERAKIHKDLQHAPEWIDELLRPITQPIS